MSTKLYIENNTAAYTPTTIRGAWDKTSDVVDKSLGTRRDFPLGTIVNVAGTEAVATADYDVLLLRAISQPMGIQTISGTVDVVLGVKESNTAANDFYHIHIFVTVGDTDVVRGTLLTDYIDSSEWSTTAQGQSLALAQALLPVLTVSGDRIVIEVGYRATNTVTTSYTGTLYYGTDPTAVDLAAADTNVTTKVGFITFSADIAFNTIESRVSQATVEVATQGTSDIRVSQATVEVATQGTSDIRVSQTALEVLVAATISTWMSQAVIEVLVKVNRSRMQIVTVG